MTVGDVEHSQQRQKQEKGDVLHHPSVTDDPVALIFLMLIFAELQFGLFDCGYNFSATLNFALRLRLFLFISASDGTIGFLVTMENGFFFSMLTNGLSSTVSSKLPCLKKVFHHAVFNRMKGDDGDASAGLQHMHRLLQQVFQRAHFIIHFYPQCLEHLRKIFVGSSFYHRRQRRQKRFDRFECAGVAVLLQCVWPKFSNWLLRHIVQTVCAAVFR